MVATVKSLGIDRLNVEERIAGLWQDQADRYSELRGASAPESAPKLDKKIEMYFIGG